MSDPGAIGTVLRDIVANAIDAVLDDDEVDRVLLTRMPDGPPSRYELVIIAKGEQFKTVVYDSSVSYPPGGPAEVLKDQLVDFVAESRFGWGQNRAP